MRHQSLSCYRIAHALGKAAPRSGAKQLELTRHGNRRGDFWSDAFETQAVENGCHGLLVSHGGYQLDQASAVFAVEDTEAEDALQQRGPRNPATAAG